MNIGTHKSLFYSGLDHENNIKKMKILTFISMAENNSEISFENIEQELEITSNQVEEFLIRGIIPFIFLILSI